MEPHSSSGKFDAQILIIVTGGTICMQRSPDGFIPARDFLKSCMAPQPSFNDGGPIEQVTIINENGMSKEVGSLRSPLSPYGKKIRYAVLEFEVLLDSSSIDSSNWEMIASTIFANYAAFDGFVVLHGTDSLAYTSSALSFMLKDLGKPVILTGSQVPMSELQSDGVDNLLGSLIIAGHFMIPEVCLFFNYNLFRGNRVTKIAAADFGAFASPNHPPLATVSAAGTKVYWHLVFRPTGLAGMSVQRNFQEAHVACLRIFPGIKAEMIRAVLNVENLKGLVLETFGAGNVPQGALLGVLGDAVKRGIVVVNVTQCLSGTVSPTYAPATALGRLGVVFGHDLTSEAALTKLSYLLGLPDITPTQVAERMAGSISGELTEATKPRFEHSADEQIPTKLATMTVLGHAIVDGDVETFENTLKTEGDKMLYQTDYMGNSLIHLAAVGPSEHILRELLQKGASVHVRNKAGHTPLYLATELGHVQHVRTLHAAGARLHKSEVVLASTHTKDVSRNGQADDETVWDLALAPTHSN